MSGSRLTGKVAVVTGAGRGIGEAIARALHADGASVVVADVSGQEHDVAASLQHRALAVRADVTDAAAVAELVRQTVETFGRLDVLCNNAGIDGHQAATADNTVENYERVMDVNARGVFLGMHHAIPAMIASGGGSIINMASVAGLVGVPGLSAYCASKGAVLGLTRAVAVEYAHAAVRCNAICPGIIHTPLMDELEQRAPETFAQVIGGAKQMTPLARTGTASEVATTAAFLASDDSSFVTGAAIPVDGGYLAL